MSANMFAALSEDQAAPVKASAASSAPQAQKSLVGGAKKTDAPKASASSPQQVTKGRLPGEVRKETTRGPRKQHAPRQDGEGRIRGREFDRHSATGRPAHSNDQRRGGAGRYNAGSLKDARADEEAAQVAATSETATEGVEAPAVATEATTEVATEAAAPAEPEIKTVSFSAFRAEQSKKTKEFEASLGTTGEARVIKPEWYKPESKTAAPAAASSSKAAAPVKQQKNFVPLSQVIGEKPQFRSEDRRGPRRDGPSGERREGSSGERREGSSGERREFNKAPRQQQGGNTRGPRKQKETFDATAASERDFPALGQ